MKVSGLYENDYMGQKRIEELDYLKCVFIVLMVVFHLTVFGDSYPRAKQTVYTFHMSAFLVMSGYLLGLNKSPRQFFRNLMWLFVPYAVMEAGYTCMAAVLPIREHIDVLTPWVLVRNVLFRPLGPYWYLHTLVVCNLAYYLIDRLLHRADNLTVIVVLALALAGLSYGAGLLTFANALYFVGGAALRRSGTPFLKFFRASPLSVVALVLLCLFPANLDRFMLAGVGITYFAMSTVLYVFAHVPGRMKMHCSFVGRHTLAVLLFSPVFTALAKVLLPLFRFDPSHMSFMLVATALALFGSFGVGYAMDRLQLSRWFCGKNLME
jgi:fucose 4-O-acetylase-like acetyltransferase